MAKAFTWLAAVLQAVGAFSMAFGYLLPAFSIFLMAGVIWMVIAIQRRDYPLIATTSVFVIADLIGIGRLI